MTPDVSPGELTVCELSVHSHAFREPSYRDAAAASHPARRTLQLRARHPSCFCLGLSVGGKRLKSVFIVALLAISSSIAIAQNSTNDSPVSASCSEPNQTTITQAASGHSAEAEALLLSATGVSDERDACLGHVLSNMANIMFVSGRIVEAERLAERSVRILEDLYPPNDTALLRPLHILASVCLEFGHTAKAREAVKRLQSIRIRGPGDSALVHETVGALLQIEGRSSEAEAEYHDTFRALEQAGRSESADAAATLYSLGSLYVEEHRLDKAWRALDRRLAICDRANDALPIDRILLLNLRGVVHARLGQWQQSVKTYATRFQWLIARPP